MGSWLVRDPDRKRVRSIPRDLVLVTLIIITIIIFIAIHLKVINTKMCGKYKQTVMVEEGATSELRKRLPQALIIGTRKSGTRALLKFLELNPNILTASKEVHFFDRLENYNLGYDWYRSQMPWTSIHGHEITIEKSPSYFVTEGVPERVREMNSTIKLLVTFRDPVIRLISDFSQLVANRIRESNNALRDSQNQLEQIEVQDDFGQLDKEDYARYFDFNAGEFNTSLVNERSEEFVWREAEKSFENYVLRPDGGINEQRRAVRVGMYSNHLEKWLAHFNKKQFHFVDGERMITNPYEELHLCELHLNLEPAIRPEDFVFSKNKGYFCINNPRYIGKWSFFYDGVVEPPISCLSNSKGRRHVFVKENLIDKLRKFYAPYNEYLYTLTGRNFSWPV